MLLLQAHLVVGLRLRLREALQPEPLESEKLVQPLLIYLCDELVLVEGQAQQLVQVLGTRHVCLNLIDETFCSPLQLRQVRVQCLLQTLELLSPARDGCHVNRRVRALGLLFLLARGLTLVTRESQIVVETLNFVLKVVKEVVHIIVVVLRLPHVFL